LSTTRRAPDYQLDPAPPPRELPPDERDELDELDDRDDDELE
jgi:hypothetical protein